MSEGLEEEGRKDDGVNGGDGEGGGVRIDRRRVSFPISGA